MTQALLEKAFTPRAFPADAPGSPIRSHFLQVPSDRMRDGARDFAKRMIGLVPDPAFHTQLVDVLHDLVLLGETRLQAALETRSDFEGFTYDIETAPEPRGALTATAKGTTDGKSSNKQEGKAASADAGADTKPKTPKRGKAASADAGG